jgi:cytochrome c556
MKAKSRERSKAMRREAGLLVGFFAVASTVLLVGFLILVGFLALAITTRAGAGTLPEAARGVPAASILPESLNSLYPPVADRPLYLLKMLSLDTSFSGIVIDMLESDNEGAKGSFGEFQSQYRQLAGTVPEWKGEFPEEPVEKLGRALASGDRGAAMKAYEAVGGICHRCHVATMVPVQQKYHWGEFSNVSVRDPLSGQETAFPQFKRFLSANLAGITVDLRQGQTENARRQFEGFRARFAALGGSCRACHEKEPRYFVDREIRATVVKIGNAFRSRTVSADEVNELLQKIGRESCSKCHRVHLPAALAGH